MPGYLNNGVVPGWPADARQTSMRQKPQSPRRASHGSSEARPEGCREPSWTEATCSYLGRCYAGGLWLLSTASAHAPAGGSALVWELGALWMEQETGYRCLMRRMKPFHPVWDSVTGRGRP